MPFLNNSQLREVGFLYVGKNVRISDKATFHGSERISIGDNTRIDDFCVVSAGVDGIEIQPHVHIGAFSSLIGAGKITLGEFSNISSRVSIFSSNDDYSGATMTNPTVPDKFKNVSHAPVSLGRHVVIGCGSVVLPGCVIPEGVAIGSLSLIKSNLEEWTIYAGVPARIIRKRDRELLSLQAELQSIYANGNM